jgi:hypothetical protein
VILKHITTSIKFSVAIAGICLKDSYVLSVRKLIMYGLFDIWNIAAASREQLCNSNKRSNVSLDFRLSKR